MSVIIYNRVIPIVGKNDLVANRMQTIAGIFNRLGAKTRLSKIAMGAFAGQYALQAAYDDCTSAMAAFEELQADSEYLELMKQRENNPGAEVVGPSMFRTIYNDVDALQEKVQLVRIYNVPRKNIPAVIELMGEVDSLSDDVNLLGVLPVASQDMSLCAAIYRFDSLSHLGRSFDGVGTSEEFLRLVEKANTLGTLSAANMNISL